VRRVHFSSAYQQTKICSGEMQPKQARRVWRPLPVRAMTRHNGSGYETMFFWPLRSSARRRIVKELVAAMWCDHLQSNGGRWECSGGDVIRRARRGSTTCRGHWWASRRFIPQQHSTETCPLDCLFFSLNTDMRLDFSFDYDSRVVELHFGTVASHSLLWLIVFQLF
jgi:hypothetical protein